MGKFPEKVRFGVEIWREFWYNHVEYYLNRFPAAPGHQEEIWNKLVTTDIFPCCGGS